MNTLMPGPNLVQRSARSTDQMRGAHTQTHTIPLGNINDLFPQQKEFFRSSLLPGTSMRNALLPLLVLSAVGEELGN